MNYDQGIPVGALVQAFVTAAQADTGAGGLALLASGGIQAGQFRPPRYANPFVAVSAFSGARNVFGGAEEIPVHFTVTADNTGQTGTVADYDTLDAIISRIEALFINHPASVIAVGTKIHQILPGGKGTGLFDPKFPKEHYGWVRVRVKTVKV